MNSEIILNLCHGFPDKLCQGYTTANTINAYKCLIQVYVYIDYVLIIHKVLQ